VLQPAARHQWDYTPFFHMPRVAIVLLSAVWTIGCPQSASAENSHSTDSTTVENPIREGNGDTAAVTENRDAAERPQGENPFSSGGTFKSERWTLGGLLYAGAHVAYNFGTARTQLSSLTRETSTSDFGSLYGGLQVGYVLPLHSKLVVGIETDVSFPNFLAGNDVVSSLTTEHATYSAAIDCLGHLRSRVGYTWGSSLWYATGGFAWSRARFSEVLSGTDSNNERAHLLAGFIAGAGVEVGIAQKWTARLEFLHDEFTWGNAQRRGAEVELPCASVQRGPNIHDADCWPRR